MKLALIILSAGLAFAQVKDAGPRSLVSFTVATLPSAASWSGYLVVVTDAATAGSCTSGSGSALSLCRSSGSAWVAVGDGGGGGAGTVTTASVVTANGFAGSVATATTTPAITLTTSITGLVKGNGTAISAATQADISSIGYVAGGGTAQAQTVTLSPAVTAQAAGMEVCWLPTAANTATAPTLAVNGLTAKTITKSGTAALVANDLTTTAIACAVYDGTQYQLQNPQTTSGSVTSVTAGASGGMTCTPTTGAVVCDIDTAYVPGKTTSNTFTGPNIFGGGTLFNGGVNAQTGTSYTFLTTDENKLTTFNNASSVAVTLPQATTTGFTVGAFFPVFNRGAGAVTITPTTSTINGSATVVLNQNQGAYIVSDGTNYSAWVSAAPTGGGTVTSVAASFTGGIISVSGSPVTSSGTLSFTPAGTSGGVPYFSSSSAWASSGAMGSGQFMLGGGAGSSPTSANLSGDVTTSGSAATTVVKINGTTLSALATGLLKNTTSTGVPSIATQSDISSPGYVAGGGTAQAQTATLSPAIAAQAAGLRVCWLPTAANTSGGPTIAVNGLTAKTITKFGTTALVANDLTTAAVACAIYDGTQYQLLNPQTASTGTISSGTTNTLSKYTAATTLGNSLLSDDGATLTYTGTGGFAAPAFSSNGTTQGFIELSPGTGNLPALVADSAGWSAPSGSGTAYLIKMMPTITAGILTVAAPGTVNNVNQSVMSVTSTSGSGNVCLSTSCAMTTPSIGAATGTSVVLTGSITSNALTSGRVPISGTSGILADDTDLTFATDTLTFTKGAATTSLTVAGAAITNNVVQNSQSAAYTTVLSDAGKHLYHPSADTTARTFTIDSNANVAYPIGTTLTFVNDTSGGVITISITSDTLVLAGAGTTGSRTLAANGIATAIKMTSTRWMINGTGLT